MMRKMMVAVAGMLMVLVGVMGVVLPAAGQTAAGGNLTGTLQAVSSTRIILATGGHTVELQISNATVIQVNGKTVGAGDLRVGMAALVITNDGRTAAEIRAESHTTTSQPATGTPVTGTISQIGGGQLTLKAGDHLLTVTLTNTTVIKLNGKIVGLGDLKVGMAAGVLASDGHVAIEVRAETPHTTTTSQPATKPTEQTGIITLIGEGRLNLQAGSHTLEFTYGNATVFKVDGKVVGAGDVKTGMSAVVIASDGKLASEVRAYTAHTTQPATQPVPVNGPTGYIRQLGEGKLTLETAIESMVFTVTEGTVYKLDGRVVGVGDIKVGMPAMVIAGHGTQATEVRAYTPHATTAPANPPSPNGQTGTISAVGDGTVTLQASAHVLTYTVASTTVIKVDGKVVGVGDLKTGLMAIVFSSDGVVATEVRAYTPPK